MNIKKTQLISLTNRKKTGKINIQLKGESIKESDSIKYLGVTVDRDLKWTSHISGLRKKASAGIACLRKLSPSIPINTRKLLFNALVRPHLDYCSVVWHACSSKLTDRVESIQNYGMRVILGKPPRTPSSPLRSQLGWTTLEQRREELMLIQVHRCIIKAAPTYMQELFSKNSDHRSAQVSTRGLVNLHLPRPSTELLRKSFSFQAALKYNSLPNELKTILTVPAFKHSVHKLFTQMSDCN